jgi:hypothetical protein
MLHVARRMGLYGKTMVRKTLIVLSAVVALAAATVWIALAATRTREVRTYRIGSLVVLRDDDKMYIQVWRDPASALFDGSELSIVRGNVVLAFPYSMSETHAERAFFYKLGGFALALAPSRRPPPHSVVLLGSPEEVTCGRYHKLAEAKPFNFAIGFPLWFVFVAFAVAPTIAFIRGPVRRWRRRRRGLCANCGYDLTGNTSGLCPECALPVAETAG